MAKIAGVHTPAELKNLAINGALDFFQRVESAVTTVNTATTQTFYAADMFKTESGGTTSKNYSIGQSSNVPSLAQSGFNSTYSLLATMITGTSFANANDYLIPFEYNMEGFDYERIHSKTVTFGFWINASVAGTYSFMARNGGGTRSYVTTFTVNGSNTWQFVPITITLDNTGTWAFDNTTGLVIFIGTVLGTGSSNLTSTLNQWQAGNFFASTTNTNWNTTTGATLRIAQFSIVEGPLGFGSTGFLRAGKTLQQELSLCQRYCMKSYDIGTAPGTVTFIGCMGFHAEDSSNAQWYRSQFPVTMRAVPSVSYWNPASGVASAFYYVQTGGSVSIAGQNPANFRSTNALNFTNSAAGVLTTGGHYIGQILADAGL